MWYKKPALWFGLLCGAGAAAMRLLAPAQMLLYGLALPFEGLGRVLRQMSLAGGGWNVLAWGLFILACGLPLWLGAVRRARKGDWGRWWMALLLGGCLAFSLYLFINPAYLSAILPIAAQAEGLLVAKTMVAGLCWSVAAAWWVLWMLGRTARVDVLQGLSILCSIFCWALLLQLCYLQLYELLCCIEGGGMQVQIYDESGAPLTGLALLGTGLSPYRLDKGGALLCLLGALPAGAALGMLHHSKALLQALHHPYSEACGRCCSRVAAWARWVVYACLVSTVGRNLLQLLRGRAGRDVNIAVELPLMELFLALALLLLADGLQRNRALKLDNDAII